MATTYTGFNETILIKDSLFSLKNALAPINAFSTKVEMTGMRKDDVVKVPIHGAATSATRTLGSDGAAGGTSVTASVTLGSPTYCQWEAVDGRDPISAFMDRAIEAAFGVAQGVLDAALAYVTASNYGNTSANKLVIPLAEFGFSDMADLNALATTKKISERKRVMILNGLYTWKFLGDTQGALIMATAGQNGIITGKLPPIGVAEAYTYAGLPSNSENLAGFVCDPSCLAVGMAPVMSLAGGAGKGNLEYEGVISDPESGVVMSYRRWYDAAAGKMSGRFEVMTGFVKCNDAVVRLLSA